MSVVEDSGACAGTVSLVDADLLLDGGGFGIGAEDGVRRIVSQVVAGVGTLCDDGGDTSFGNRYRPGTVAALCGFSPEMVGTGRSSEDVTLSCGE